MLGMKESKSPVRYLGVLIDGKRIPIRFYDPIIEKMQGKMEG